MSDEPKTPWQEAAHNLHECGYLYLGIKDRPKPIEGAEEIIKAACERHCADLRAEVARLQGQAAATQTTLRAIKSNCYAAMEGAGMPEFSYYETWMNMANEALSPNAGRGYVPIEWAKELLDTLDELATCCTCGQPPEQLLNGALRAPGPHTENCVHTHAKKALAEWHERTKEGK